MAGPRDIQVFSEGRRWSGTFTIEGRELSVASAYGSGRVPFGRRKPELVAKELLLGIVERRARG